MNDAIRTMLIRRSVRTYESEQITDEQLETILQCALYAPTSSNCQTSRFLVIQDSERLTRLNAAICKELAGREEREGQIMNVGIRAARQEGMNFFYGAPTLITAVAPRDYDNSMANCAAGLENVILAATSLGLGACWSNQAHWLTNVPAIRSAFEELGLREDEDIFGSVEVGYPKRISQRERPRKEGRVVLDLPRELK